MDDGLGAEQLRLATRHRRDRGTLRRLAETRGFVGGHRAPHVPLRIRTADGVRLSAAYLPGPSPDAPAVLIGHGFAANRRKPAYALLGDVLAGFAHVLTIDLRGHGRSHGRSTFGTRERHDIDAGVRWLRAHGHTTVVPVGVSMGAASVLHAVATGTPATAVVVVSSPAYHGTSRSVGLRDLQRWIRHPLTRWSWQAIAGFRFEHPDRWERYPDPVALAGRLDVPLLVVHGDDDHFFPPEEAEALARAGGGVLWQPPAGFGHAEDGIVPAVAVALGRAVEAVVRTGAFPARPASDG